MERSDLTTPVKHFVNVDDVAIATPTGGLIFNPFHKEFMNRVGQANFSPGVFACNPSPVSKDDSLKNTPNRLSAPFILSPDTQGLLFPAEIDENPVLQMKLQEKLDTQCDDDIQDTIHSFFKSHLIAPSPDTLDPRTHNRTCPLLPRTSSIIPNVTPKVKRSASCAANPVPIPVNEVAVQTALSVPPEYDLVSLIQNALDAQFPKDCVASATPTKLNHESEIHQENSLYSSPSKPLTGRPCLTACTVQRPFEEISNRHHFLCVSCRKPHSLSQYSRRSLFSDSSSVVDEYWNVDGMDISSAHRTLVPPCSAPSQPVCSTYLSSSMITDDGRASEHEDSVDLCYLFHSENDGQSVPDTCDGNQSENSRPSSSIHQSDALCFRSTKCPDASPSTPPSTRLQSYHVENRDIVDQTSQTPNWSIRRRFSLQSPYFYRDPACMGSPNLSPILPSSPIAIGRIDGGDCTMHTHTSHAFTSPDRLSAIPFAPLQPKPKDSYIMDDS